MEEIGNARCTSIDPGDLCRVHVQVCPDRRRHSHNTTLKERLLADGHCGRQYEQTFLDSRAEAFGTRCMTDLFISSEANFRAFFLVALVV